AVRASATTPSSEREAKGRVCRISSWTAVGGRAMAAHGMGEYMTSQVNGCQPKQIVGGRGAKLVRVHTTSWLFLSYRVVDQDSKESASGAARRGAGRVFPRGS